MTPSAGAAVLVAVLGITVLLAAAFFALPHGGWLQTWLFVSASTMPAALVVWRLHHERLLHQLPWAFFAASTATYALATLLWSLLPLLTGQDLPFPSLPDAAYFSSYLLAAAFLTGLIHRRYRHAEDAVRGAVVALLDAGLFAFAAIAVLWPALIGPNLSDPRTVGLEQAVAVGYPLLTAVVLGLVVRLAISGRRRSPAQWLLLLWASGELAGDIFYGYLSASGSFRYGHPISAAWLLSYVALAFLARHADLTGLGRGDGTMPLQGWRLALPLGAVLVPGVMAVTSDSALLDVVALAAGVLVVVRFWLLSGDLAEQRRLAAELAALSREFEHQSLHDPLTGLANRALFNEQLHAAWQAHRRHGRGLALLMVDLDGFKLINDRFGHHTGDRLLIEVARRLADGIRGSDTLARLGGDEFALILPETALHEARTIAERVHERLGAALELDGRPHQVAASIGIARSSERVTPDSLLRDADTALYVAKAAGKGRTAVHDPTSAAHGDEAVAVAGPGSTG